MRELSTAELALVTGGGGSGDPWLAPVEVSAWSYDWGAFDLYTHAWQMEPGAEYYWDYDGGGGDGSASQECELNDDLSVDSYTDALASSIAREIMAKPDHNSREYLSVIYRDASGEMRHTDLFAGGTVEATQDFANYGIATSAVLGVVHNHPHDTLCGTLSQCNANRLPSEGDWGFADKMISELANPAQFTLFLLGTDSVFREYNYANKSSFAIPPTGTSQPGPTLSQTLQPSECSQ